MDQERKEFFGYLVDNKHLNETYCETRDDSQGLFSRVEDHFKKCREEITKRKRLVKPSKSLSSKKVTPERLANRIRELYGLLENKIQEYSAEVVTSNYQKNINPIILKSFTAINQNDHQDKLTVEICQDEQGIQGIVLLHKKTISDINLVLKEQASLFPNGSFVFGKNYIHDTFRHRWRDLCFSASKPQKKCGLEIIQSARTVERLSRWFLEDSLSST